MTKLTRTERARITEDWLGQFPGLGVHRPLHLLRRVGPMLEGIILDRTSSNDEYRPTFHVHSLLRDTATIGLTLYQRLVQERSGAEDDISVVRHPSKYVEAANRLTRQSPLPLVGDLKLSDVLRAYNRRVEAPGVHYDADLLYEDMAAFCGWIGDAERAKGLIDRGFVELGTWPSDALLQIGGRELWREKMMSLVVDRHSLHALMEREIHVLKVESIPVASLLLD